MRWRQTVAAGLAMVAAGVAEAQPSPADLYGDLFRAVQEGRVFPDGKTFVDAVPRGSPTSIMADFAREKPAGRDTLRAFVLAHFTVPGVNDGGGAALRAHIRGLWPTLVRQPIPAVEGGSAVALPEPYVVPGGRFREMYYWDSYFTMLGLAVDGQQPLVESMLADFTAVIERHGRVPNGMRTYYLSRSQPPFFALMLDLSQERAPAVQARRLQALKREHAFWTTGERVVRMPDGSLLNRYWDDRDAPRDESYAEDLATQARTKRPVMRELRAAAESGWDFSSRWLADPQALSSIRTTEIVPVDLNSLLFAMERRIAARCQAAGDARCAADFDARASRRRAAIDRYLWVPGEGRYADWDTRAGKRTAVLSAATLYPLFVEAASPEQARAVAATTRAKLMAPGGLRTTGLHTGQQWDAPNGWAPLQWVAVAALARYGEDGTAREVARRWLDTVGRTYAETGKMLEKYDVEERKPGGGGEYPLQDGFGWTNGVASALMERYPDLPGR